MRTLNLIIKESEATRNQVDAAQTEFNEICNQKWNKAGNDDLGLTTFRQC